MKLKRISVYGEGIRSNKISLELETDITPYIATPVLQLKLALIDLMLLKEKFREKYGEIDIIDKENKCITFRKKTFMFREKRTTVCREKDVERFIDLLEYIYKLARDLTNKIIEKALNNGIIVEGIPDIR